MANGLSMKVLLQLQAKQFNQGINQVKKSITGLGNTIKSLAGTIAGGLGFAKIAQELKDTATQMSVAKAMLQNISTEITKTGKEFNNYAENLEFVKRISKEYNQDHLTLIKGFAQFSAAAKSCNVPLEDQKFIYEALTRAAAGFHMSADQANNMMLAVTQMMSKGTVAAEELRRQLGNSLPGAFGLMADALGVTNPELEKMMRSGDVLAKDALPKLAAKLNEITQDMSFDSLQGSLNKFKNSWYELVENSNFGNFYKKIIDFGAKGLDYIAENFQEIAHWAKVALVSIGSFLALKTGFKVFNGLIAKGSEEYKKMAAEIETLNAANAKLVSTNKKLFKSLEPGGSKKVDTSNLAKIKPADLKAINEYNGNLQKIAKNMKSLGNGLYLESFKKEFNDINRQSKEISKYLKQSGDYINGFTRITSKLSALFKGLWVTVKGIAMSMAAMAIISAVIEGVSLLLGYTKKLREEANRIKNIVKDYQKEQANILKNTTEEETELKRCKKIITDSNKTYGEHKNAVEKVNKILGLNGDEAYDTNKIFDKTGKLINNEIIKGIDLWIRKMKILSQLSYNVNKITEASNKNIELNSKLDDLNKQYEKKTGAGLWASRFGGGQEGVDRQTGAMRPETKDKGWIRRNVLPVINEINANNNVIKMANDAIEKYEEELARLTEKPEVKKELTGTTSEIKEALDDYIKSLKELENQKKNGVFNNSNGTLNEEKYQEALANIQNEAWETIAAFSNLEIELKKLGSTYVETAAKLKKDFYTNLAIEEKKALEKEKKDTEESNEEKKKAFGKAFAKWKADEPQYEGRDTFFDYKKSFADMAEEDLEQKQKYLDELERWKDRLEDLQITYRDYFSDDAKTALTNIIQLMDNVRKATDDMTNKSHIAQWTEDLKEAKDKLAEIKSEGFENFASSVSTLGNAIHNVAESIATLGDTELSEETQKFFSKLDAGINILNSIAQTVNMITTITEFLNKKKEAQLALDTIIGKKELVNSLTKLGLIKAEEKEELKSAGATVGAETIKQAEIGATTTALAGEAVAGAASSQAGIPIVGPILAAAAVAGIVALLMSNMKKFAKGGIVGGNSTTGDNNVVRANSGELILNKAQQGTLYEAIATGKLGGAGGEWKVRGTDLIKVINNTQNKIRG